MNQSIYLPQTDIQQAWGVEMTAVGHGVAEAGKSYPLAGHPDDHQLPWQYGRVIDALQIIYIDQGQGEFESRRTGRQPIHPNAVFLVFPGVWHRYRPLAEIGWTEDWIELRGPTIRSLLRQRVLDPACPVLRPGQPTELLGLMRKTLRLATTKPPGFEAVVAAIGLQILALLKLRQTVDDSEQSAIAAAVSKSQTLIAQRVQRRLRTEELAAEVGVSESYFRRAFKYQTGLTPKQYHMALRLRWAQDALVGTSLTVKEIAARLHFDSAFHLSAYFKAKTGLSPTMWRRRASRPT